MSWGKLSRVYKGHGNLMTLIPYADVRASDLLDMSGVTEVRVCVGSAPIASSTAMPSVIAWEQSDPDDSDSHWLLNLRLGMIPDIEPGEQNVRVVVYDADYPTGLVVTGCLNVLVVEEC
jgi:hypothetical protein